VTLLDFIVSDGCESDTVATRVIVQCTQVGLPGEPVITVFAVGAARPNPFRGSTGIRLSLPESREVQAEVYDVAGRRVAVLLDRDLEAGEWEISWDGFDDAGRTTAAGLYFVRVRAGDAREVRRVLRLR
jgi:hypothetical protein